MLKKVIPMFLALCMIIGSTAAFGTGYEVSDGFTAASADAEQGPASSASSDTNKVTLNNSVLGTQKQVNEANALSADGNTPTDGADADISNSSNQTTDNGSTDANLDENNSKNNGMAAGPIPEVPAASRYSTIRLSLAPDISGTKYEEAAELLGALGIMVGDAENGAFRPDDPIKRSEMAKVAVYSVGLEDMAVNSNGTTRFPDVPSDHWATGAINIADQQGMVVGDDVGTYRPDDPVLLQEAVAIIVRAMGYEPAAADKGGYPAGYLYIASSNQLLRGISGATAAAATRGDIAQLIFNSLTVKLMEQVGYGTQTKYEVVDKTLLYDKLNVEKGYGQVTGTGETALSGGNTTAEDRIQIGDKIFYLGESNAKQFLGYNVLYYARIDKTSDEKTIIDIREQANKNKTATIAAKDIVAATGDADKDKTVEYWSNENDRNTKTATVAADAVFIYNGKYKAGVTAEQMKPESGNLILLDADTNGIYEIVFVNHFTNIVVDTISTVTGRVTDKYMNGSLVFDDNDSDVMYSLIKNGEEIKVGDLKEWNVISYTISEDKQLVKGYVSDASVNGTITEITDKGYRIGSGSTLYKKASSYPNDINLRDKGTFYLDVEGKIAAVDENATVDDNTSENKKYGYLVDAKMNDGFETTAQFKIFTASGETSIITSTEKMRYNSSYGTKAEDVVNSLKNGGSIAPQLINYELNSSGAITAIDTAKDGTSTGAPNKGTFTLNLNKKDIVYKSASGKLGNIGVDSNTIIFDIPTSAGTDTDKYSVRNNSSLSNDTSYDIMVYDLQDNYMAKVIIITSTTGTTSAESPIVVVDHISETQNADYDTTDRLYGWEGGKEVNILAADKTILRKKSGTSTKELQTGDIIQYRTNSDGEIDGITLLFDSNAKNTEFINNITNDLTCVYGRVTKKFSGSVNVSVNDDIRNWATGDATVYLYDSTRNSNNIRVVSPADIEIYEEGNEARLFIRVYQDKVQEMVIVR